MSCLMLGRETGLNPLPLHGFLQCGHHEVGFLHELVDEVRTFMRFHWCTPSWMLAYHTTGSPRVVVPVAQALPRLGASRRGRFRLSATSHVHTVSPPPPR